jgi:hypothetical protein
LLKVGGEKNEEIVDGKEKKERGGSVQLLVYIIKKS